MFLGGINVFNIALIVGFIRLFEIKFAVWADFCNTGESDLFFSDGFWSTDTVHLYLF